MMCDNDKLTELARDELSGAEAADAERHAESCERCARELAWARAEQMLFGGRTRPGVPAHAWQGIERRVTVAREGRERRRRFWAGAGAMGTLAAAAMTMLMFAKGAHNGTTIDAGVAVGPDQGAQLAVDHAEAEYSRAIAVLDADWQVKRTGLPAERARRVDEELSRLKEQMKKNESIAVDLEGRRKALRTYSAYVRTVQAAVLEESP
jgi:hypothetical protein